MNFVLAWRLSDSEPVESSREWARFVPQQTDLARSKSNSRVSHTSYIIPSSRFTVSSGSAEGAVGDGPQTYIFCVLVRMSIYERSGHDPGDHAKALKIYRVIFIPEETTAPLGVRQHMASVSIEIWPTFCSNSLGKSISSAPTKEWMCSAIL